MGQLLPKLKAIDILQTTFPYCLDPSDGIGSLGDGKRPLSLSSSAMTLRSLKKQKPQLLPSRVPCFIIIESSPAFLYTLSYLARDSVFVVSPTLLCAALSFSLVLLELVLLAARPLVTYQLLEAPWIPFGWEEFSVCVCLHHGR